MEGEVVIPKEDLDPALAVRYLDFSPEWIDASKFPKHPAGRYVSLDDLEALMGSYPWLLGKMLDVVRAWEGEAAP